MDDDNLFSVILTSVALIFGGLFGWSLATDSWRQEVVKRGFAEWQLKEGTRYVEFKWKENE